MNGFIWLDILLHIYARWHTDDSEKYKKNKKKRFVCCHSVDTAGVLFKRNAGCDRVFTRGYAEKKKKMWQLATKSWSSTKYCMLASSWKFRLKEKKTQHALSQLGGAMGLPHTRRSHSLHEWRRSWMTLLGEMFGEKKSCRYESKDIFWFDSHLFGAAIKGWFTPTDTRSYNFTDKRVNCDNYMWPSCNYSPPERHSQGGRRLGYSGGETPVWQVTFWGWEITSPARCSLTPNICLLLFSHGDLEGCFFFMWNSSESTCGALTRCEEQQPQAPFICHLAITAPPRQGSDSWSGHHRTRLGLRRFHTKLRGKRKSKADRTDSYHTGWCAAVVSQDRVRLRLGFSSELKAVHQRKKKVVICNFGEKGSSIKGYLWRGFHLQDQ